MSAPSSTPRSFRAIAQAPRVYIEFPFEQRPAVRIVCQNYEEEERIRWWIDSHPDLAEVVDLALALQDAA